MRAFFLVAILAFSGRSALATPQIPQKVVFGQQTYVLQEFPMLGRWHYGKGSRGTGRQKPPPFDLVTTANHAGYEAEFEIRDAKFWLKGIAGQINGKEQVNEEIIPGKQFPIVADWFTGRIHLEAGEFDYDRQEANSVIIFHVDKGVITRTTFAERMRRVGTWNGLSHDHKPLQSTVTIQGIGEVTLPPGTWLLERVSNTKQVDCYLFEKEGARLERLSFRVYKGNLADSVHAHEASIDLNIMNGVPRDVLKPDEDWSGTRQVIRPTTHVNEHCLTATSIWTPQAGEPWVYHSAIGKWKETILICSHCSQHVISPDVVKGVYLQLKESPSE